MIHLLYSHFLNKTSFPNLISWKIAAAAAVALINSILQSN